jgi:colanic acid/amylovoran biosynthesis glycosyltransferase
MSLAYFVNQYPKVSHSFIRRELMAVEQLGRPVLRYALRGWDDNTLVDPDDVAELGRTRYALQPGMPRLALHLLGWALRRPMDLWRGCKAAWQMAHEGDRTWLHHAVALAEAARLVSWWDQAGVDHVHTHFGTNSAEVAYLARALGGPPYSLTIHGSEEWDHPEELKLREKVCAAAFVVGISSFTRAQLMRWATAADWHKIHEVHCGLDADFFEQAATPVPDNHRLVCIGRLCKEKAQRLLVQAVAELVRRGQPVELVLAGDGEDRPALEACIAQWGLKDQVRITGWVSNAQVRELLAQSRGLVMSSFAEALPVVLMEAMALRRPVVATLVGGVAELVRSGEEGWLVPTGDVQRLADAMQSLLQAPVEQLRRMGEQGYQRARARHDVRKEAAKLLSLIDAAQRATGPRHLQASSA